MILTTSKGLKQDVDLLGLDGFLSEKSLGRGVPFSTGHYGRGEKAIRVSFYATGPEKNHLVNISKRHGISIWLEGPLNLPEILNECED
jgi:hypothetical protein